MINIDRADKSLPYMKFYDLYEDCLVNKQRNPQAIVISSYNTNTNEVDARLVNLKYILGEEWIFFTNYNSPKSIQINDHKQISAVLYWDSIDVQVRLKAFAKKTSDMFSNKHFNSRSDAKNALATSSDQSSPIKTYEEVISNFDKVMLDKNNYNQRPSYWGGYSFIPYTIEFWKGHESRLNRRIKYTKREQSWKAELLQP